MSETHVPAILHLNSRTSERAGTQNWQKRYQCYLSPVRDQQVGQGHSVNQRCYITNINHKQETVN